MIGTQLYLPDFGRLLGCQCAIPYSKQGSIFLISNDSLFKLKFVLLHKSFKPFPYISDLTGPMPVFLTSMSFNSVKSGFARKGLCCEKDILRGKHFAYVLELFFQEIFMLFTLVTTNNRKWQTGVNVTF